MDNHSNIQNRESSAQIVTPPPYQPGLSQHRLNNNFRYWSIIQMNFTTPLHMNLMNHQDIQLTQRESWADLCRISAIFGVILIHVSATPFCLYGKISQAAWLSANLLDSVARCSVPLFIMLSGALLLKPEAKPITILQIAYRIRKVFIPLLSWSILYIYDSSHNLGISISFLDIFSAPTKYHLWFVYMIIGIYVLLPILQSIYLSIYNQTSIQIYLFVAWIITSCVPIYYNITLVSSLKLGGILNFSGYFLIGAFIASNNRYKFPTYVWAIAYATGIGITFLITLQLSIKENTFVQTAYAYMSPNVALSSVSAFILFRRISINHHVAPWLLWLSDKTFIIYFVHIAVFYNIYNTNIFIQFDKTVPTFISILTLSILIFITSLMIAIFIRRFVPHSRFLFG
jgi:surface polysaccharide O-acyltransferase-like enzyme